MKNTSISNLFVLAAIVIVVLMILGFITNLLSSIVPLILVAVVAFLLGRASNKVNLMQAGLGLFRQASKQVKAAQQAPKREVTVKPMQKSKTKTVEVPVTESRQKQAEENLADVEMKTEEQILAEARLREEEIRKSGADYDPMAALEERRRRLLGGEQKPGE